MSGADDGHSWGNEEKKEYGPVNIHKLNGTEEYKMFLKIADIKNYQKAGFFKEIMNFWLKYNPKEVE